MMRYFLFYSFLIVLSFSCKKDDKPTESSCISERVRSFSKSEICDSGALVTEYKFNDEMVYVFNQGNCGADFQEAVYDASCNSIGYLGGIAGNMDVDGVNFYDNAVWQRTLFSN